MTADTLHPNPDIARALARIYGMHRTSIDMRLHRSPYETLLDSLGHPERKLPPVIHVAGTNGKGSTIAFLRAMYEHAGYRVHTYTSPHLFTFNERIRLAGDLISDDALLALIARLDAIDLPDTLTFFEYTTALALLAMAETPADICLLETGMGGRLDCTNVVPDKALTIITKISHDHTEFLGTDIAAITGEKAGIMQRNVACVVAKQFVPDAALPVLKDKALQLSAPLFIADADWRVRDNTFVYRDMQIALGDLPLKGQHQIDNAATALMAVTLLQDRFPMTRTQMQDGLQDAYWPGRLTQVENPALNAAMGMEIWYDGGHNDSGAAALAVQCGLWQAQGKDVHLIAGLGEDKDPAVFLDPFLDCTSSLTLIDLPIGRRPQQAAEAHAKLPQAMAAKVRLAQTPQQALAQLPQGEGDAIALFCGSLYLATLILSQSMHK
jgi:dihydrofolate synthase/folylpolyglutamate synthase